MEIGNILSYLKWRGDLDFTERSFCEVDNLVLSCLIYLEFRDIVTGCQKGISIWEVSENILN